MNGTGNPHRPNCERVSQRANERARDRERHTERQREREGLETEAIIVFVLLSSLYRSNPITWSQKSAEPTRPAFNSCTLKAQVCEVAVKVAAWLRLRRHSVNWPFFVALVHGQVFMTSGRIEDFKFAEKTGTTPTKKNKYCTPPNIAPDAIFTVMWYFVCRGRNSQKSKSMDCIASPKYRCHDEHASANKQTDL